MASKKIVICGAGGFIGGQEKARLRDCLEQTYCRFDGQMILHPSTPSPVSVAS